MTEDPLRLRRSKRLKVNPRTVMEAPLRHRRIKRLKVITLFNAPIIPIYRIFEQEKGVI